MKSDYKRHFYHSYRNTHITIDGIEAYTNTNNNSKSKTMNSTNHLELELLKCKYPSKTPIVKCDIISYYNNWISDLRPDKQTNLKSDIIAKETDSTGVSWLKARIIHGIHVILFQYNLCVCNPIFFCTSDKSEFIDRNILIGFFEEEVRLVNQINPISIGALWEYYVSMSERMDEII